MSDVAASPNDPVFINHHAMIDCIFERWIQKNKDDLAYPDSSEIREGHGGNDTIVPIIPLYMEKEMFMPAENFGYTCDTSTDPTDTDDNTNPTGTGGNKNPSDTNPTSPDTGVTTNLSNTIIVIIVAVVLVNLMIGGGS